MESKRIFEDSNKELSRISKELSSDEVRIDFTKLDLETKGHIISSLRTVISDRKKDIEKVIIGVN